MTLCGPVFVVLAIALIILCMWAFFQAVFGEVRGVSLLTCASCQSPSPAENGSASQPAAQQELQVAVQDAKLTDQHVFVAGILGPEHPCMAISACSRGMLGVLQHTLQLHHVRENTCRQHA